MSEVNYSDALYRWLTGGRSPATEPNTLPKALGRIVAGAGSVSGAARLLDVPRSTVRGWIAGRRPKGNAAAVVVQTAVGMERRDRLRPGRERRLAAQGRVTFEGQQKGRPGGRTVTLSEDGLYLRGGTIRAVIDAFLSGAPIAALGVALHRGITDDFYRAMFHPRHEGGGSPVEQRRTGGGGGGAGDDDEDQDDDETWWENHEEPYDDGEDLAYEGFAPDLDSDYALAGASAS
jgi:hypothetical protein